VRERCRCMSLASGVSRAHMLLSLARSLPTSLSLSRFCFLSPLPSPSPSPLHHHSPTPAPLSLAVDLSLFISLSISPSRFLYFLSPTQHSWTRYPFGGYNLRYNLHHNPFTLTPSTLNHQTLDPKPCTPPHVSPGTRWGYNPPGDGEPKP